MKTTKTVNDIQNYPLNSKKYIERTDKTDSLRSYLYINRQRVTRDIGKSRNRWKDQYSELGTGLKTNVTEDE